MIEPLMIMFVGSIVGPIAVAVLMPSQDAEALPNEAVRGFGRNGCRGSA